MIERLLKREYALDLKRIGTRDALELNPKYALSLQEMEDGIREVLSPEHSELFFSLKQTNSEEDCLIVMTAICGSELGSRLATACSASDWTITVTRFYCGLISFADAVGTNLVRWKEKLAPYGSQKIESAMWKNPGMHSLYIQQEYRKQLMRLFPNMVKRASGLQIIPAKQAPRYLSNDASALPGQFLGVLR